ncbi:MAG: hypothetical protein GXY43_07905 [Clostridiaceae bacterium]|nr:hypothetical protein [Clostridiaceae bacterium]
MAEVFDFEAVTVEVRFLFTGVLRDAGLFRDVFGVVAMWILPFLCPHHYTKKVPAIRQTL